MTALAGGDKPPVTQEVIKEFMDNLTRGLNQTNPDLMEAVEKLKLAGLKVKILDS